MLLGTICSMCGAPGGPVCVRCWPSVRPAQEQSPPPGLDACWSLLSYDGPARALVVGLKYRNARAVLGRLGTALGRLVALELAAMERVAVQGLAGNAPRPSPIDVVTWAPTSARRARARGYDQAELLARAVARTLRRPCRPLLARADGPPQTGAGRRQRLVGPTFTFAAVGTVAGRVLVVDDVLTTGATMREAAHALREHGVAPVCGATVARTPDGGRNRTESAALSVRAATVGGRMAQLPRPAS